MNICLEHIRVEGLEAVVLANDALRLVVIPELGGKIVSLRSQRTGREWLWKNPFLPLAKPPLDARDFGRYDAGGWDEIFPTVNPCQVPDSAWGDSTLTDHGELWYRPWQTLVAKLVKNESASLTLAVDNPDLPFRFERTLKLSAGLSPLEINYEVTNLGDRPLTYLWAGHPLIAIEPDNVIRLPTGTTMSSTASVGLEIATDAVPFTWPHLPIGSGDSLDLSRVPIADAGFAIKLFAENVSTKYIEVVDHKSREMLKISFEPGVVAHFGLWLNYGAWSGAQSKPYYNIGVEPTSSPHDDLSIAARQTAVSAVQPGGSHQWNVKVFVGKESR